MKVFIYFDCSPDMQDVQKNSVFNHGIICIKTFSIIFAIYSYNYKTLEFVIVYQSQDMSSNLFFTSVFVRSSRIYFRCIIWCSQIVYNSQNIQSIQELLLKQRDNASRKVFREEKSSFLHLIDLQRIKKAKLSRNRYADTERAQCVLCIAEWYGKTAVQRIFMEKQEQSHRVRSTVREWYQAYQSRGSNTCRGENGRPRISSTVRNEIPDLFENDPQILSLKYHPKRVSLTLQAGTFCVKS